MDNFVTGWAGGIVVTATLYGLMYYYNRRADKKKNRKEQIEDGVELKSMVVPQGIDHDTTPKVRVGVIQAMNGRVLEVATAVPHPGHHGHYDWKTEMYIVPEDQKLSEALAFVLIMKGLE